MKTPEEIKKGLDICSRLEEIDECEGCPYCTEGQILCGITTMMKDAIAYIEQLEDHISLTSVIIMEMYRLEAACGEEAYAEELADVIIAALSVAGKLGIDIDKAVRRKMEINKARPWKHGKEG